MIGNTDLDDSLLVLVYQEQYVCCVRQSFSITSNTLSNAGGVRVNTGQKRQQHRGAEGGDGVDC